MAKIFLPSLVLVCLCAFSSFSDLAITVYNQDFAVVRDTLNLNLQKGINKVQYSGMTAHLETDSVILRDPLNKQRIQILEQNYRSDPVTQELLLSLNEGKTLDFQVERDGKKEIIKGKIIRSGYVPHQSGIRKYSGDYYQTQMSYASGTSQPVIEVDGKLRFTLPGLPLFPSLSDDTILKPTLFWVIETDKTASFDAELCYITGGMSWEANYNLVAPETANNIDLVGWVTIDNQSGKNFDNTKIKLLAGDVSKIQDNKDKSRAMATLGYMMDSAEMQKPVSEKSFDEYHLYTLNNKTTLHDRETKQVEFVRATNVKSNTIYVYDGAIVDYYWNFDSVQMGKEYGAKCNKKIWIMREFENSTDNNLGIPLPKGKLRFYRRDDDGNLEFIGENTIDHTPKDELIRVYTGNVFDIVGERKQTNFVIDTSRKMLDESFEINIRNRKKTQAEIRIVEHLYRWSAWEITRSSHSFDKKDSKTIEFNINIPPNSEKTVSYNVHYTW